MPTLPRLSAGAVRALILAALFAAAGVVLIVMGWPEEHLWQSVLLQVSWLAFDAAVFAIVWHAVRSRRLLDNPTPRFRICMLLLIGGVGLGLLLYLIALLTKHAMLTPLGQLCIAIGLGAMACYVAAVSLTPSGPSHVETVPELAALMDVDDEDAAGETEPDAPSGRASVTDPTLGASSSATVAPDAS